jgi:hypothetical protein
MTTQQRVAPAPAAAAASDAAAASCGGAWPLRYVWLPDDATAAAIMERSMLCKVRRRDVCCAACMHAERVCWPL